MDINLEGKFVYYCKKCGIVMYNNPNPEKLCQKCNIPMIISDIAANEYKEKAFGYLNKMRASSLDSVKHEYVQNPEWYKENQKSKEYMKWFLETSVVPHGEFDYNAEVSKYALYNTGIISEQEYDEYLKRTVPTPTTNEVRCPKCSSTQIQVVPKKWSLLMGILTNKVDRVCVNCKHKF